jgi:hypothetical protein
MLNILKCASILFTLLLFLLITTAFPVMAVGELTGSLDINGVDRRFSGWFIDTDYAGATPIHVYIDNAFWDVYMADKYRADVGSHAFDFTLPALGSGSHSVVLYGIDLNVNGSDSGRRMSFTGTINQGCADLTRGYYPMV